MATPRTRLHGTPAELRGQVLQSNIHCHYFSQSWSEHSLLVFTIRLTEESKNQMPWQFLSDSIAL